MSGDTGNNKKKLGPFDFLNDINSGTKTDQYGIMCTEEDEKAYIPFLTNRSLSYHEDAVIMANEINLNAHIDNRLQYDFFRRILRPRSRFCKWTKPENLEDIEVIKEWYMCSENRAREIYSILNASDIDYIKRSLDHGGIKHYK